nr:MAG TPA: attachment protein [Inoviridae sp.]
MKNDTRSNVHHRHTALCLALSAALFAAPVSAEVGLPPPAQHQGAGFPSEQALRQKGYDPKTGVWRVQSQNNGRPTVTKSGDTIKGSQPKTVTATGNYGEKGTFRTTQTQTVSSSKLQNTINGVWVGGALANAVDKHIDLMDARIRSGDYKGAVESGVLMAGTFGNNLFGGLAESLGNMGRRLGLIDSPSPQDFRQAADRFYQWQMQKEQGGDLGEAIAAAAAKKAAEQAAKAAEQAAKAAEQAAKAAKENKSESGKHLFIVRWSESAWEKSKDSSKSDKHVENVVWKSYSAPTPSGRSDSFNYTLQPGWQNFTYTFSNGFKAKFDLKFSDAEKYRERSLMISEFPANPENIRKTTQSNITPEEMMLNQQDIKDILSRMLNNQQTNHAELMNQLAKIGDAVEKSTESNQFTPMTADSAPYTPQGSNTPQQTRFTLNADGSVSTSIIPRPDLKPNSTLAPTRSEIIPTPNKGQNTPTTPDSPNTPTTPDSPNAPTTPNSPNNPNTPNQPNNPTGQQNQNQENQKQDFCQQNPNAAQCMSGGDTTYEDIVLPENTIDLSFSPENVFQTEGVCPQPKSVDLGAFGQVEFSYQPLCDFAAKLRPVLIMMTILTCAWFVYGALEEL